MGIENKICLITGASRGIGKAITLKLARCGATVIGTATTSGGADSISDYLGQHKANGRGIVLDVNDNDRIAEIIKDITETYGNAPDILINNAGIAKDNLFLRMKDNEWNDIISTNLSSVYKLTKSCIKHMTKSKYGRIVNISSVVGVTGNAGQVNYCAAKAGVIGFTKALAQEMASRNITVNAVAPGFIESDMTNKLSKQTQEAILSNVPMNRLGQAEDIANAVSFLVSDDASYITGATLHVNGGLHMD